MAGRGGCEEKTEGEVEERLSSLKSHRDDHQQPISILLKGRRGSGEAFDLQVREKRRRRDSAPAPTPLK